MEDGKFWVLFDTATRPEYYQDVHKVLALPEGALLEYEYRDIRMEAEAIVATKKKLQEVPRQVLVIYAQSADFIRGHADPTGVKPLESMHFQALRRGTLVALWRDGQYAHFQFQLADHPRADPSLLAPVIGELSQRSAVPYSKWVVISEAGSALKQLVADDQTVEWQETVDRLSTLPMQFNDDKFLRFHPPGRTRWGSRRADLRSKYPKRPGHPHALDHQYVVPERCQFALRISTHEPSGASAGGVLAPAATYKAEVSPEGPLLEPSPKSGPIRRTAEATINLESRHSAKAEAKIGRLRIISEDALPAVAGGIEFVFALKLAPWKRMLGVFLALLGALGAIACGALTASGEISVLVTILMAAASVCVGGLGGFYITGVWTFKT
jgi:hypothetical protein